MLTHYTIMRYSDHIYIVPNHRDDTDHTITWIGSDAAIPSCCLTHANQIVHLLNEGLLDARLVEEMTVEMIDLATQIDEATTLIDELRHELDQRPDDIGMDQDTYMEEDEEMEGESIPDTVSRELGPWANVDVAMERAAGLRFADLFASPDEEDDLADQAAFDAYMREG